MVYIGACWGQIKKYVTQRNYSSNSHFKIKKAIHIFLITFRMCIILTTHCLICELKWCLRSGHGFDCFFPCVSLSVTGSLFRVYPNLLHVFLAGIHSRPLWSKLQQIKRRIWMIEWDSYIKPFCSPDRCPVCFKCLCFNTCTSLDEAFLISWGVWWGHVCVLMYTCGYHHSLLPLI